MSLDSLNALFLDELKDVLNAEKQILTALPKMAKAAESQELATAFTDHLKETKGHVARLEQIFGLLNETARGKKCKGMEGLLEEGKEIMEEEGEGSVIDAALDFGRTTGRALRDRSVRLPTVLRAVARPRPGCHAPRADVI